MATTTPLSDWSKLVPDVLSLVYKRLSFVDFARARTICSSWYPVSRSSSPRKNQIPWLILNQNSKWQLFNPEEGKFYKTHINQLEFANCRSIASCGSWVLLTDDKANLYIINPFTLEIFNLPPLKSNDKTLGIQEEQRISEPVTIVETAVVWVEERTNDFLVVWTSKRSKHLTFCRKGDEEWTKKPCEYLGRGVEDEDVGTDMAYKDKKLYILTGFGRIRILDFSQDFPKDVLNHPYINTPFNNKKFGGLRLKLTTSGNVLIIRWRQRGFKIWFKVYEMNWTKVDSLEEEENEVWGLWERVEYFLEGREAVVWDLSVTLPTYGVSGIKKDSVYYSKYFSSSIMKFGNQEIPTGKVGSYEIYRGRRVYFEQCSHLLGVEDARWFLPCFGVDR